MKRFGTILLYIIVLELILGGGGRFMAYELVSLRMVLFAVAIVYTVLALIKGARIGYNYIVLLVLFIALTVFSTLMGFLSKADMALIFQDVKPLSYFLILPFFVLTISDKAVIGRISEFFIYAPLLLALLYLFILLLFYSGALEFIAFYNLTFMSEELFYRGELAFFYKGFIFLCVGLIFLYFLRPRYYRVYATIIALAIILTFTRGFIFALSLTAISYLILKGGAMRRKIIKLSFLVGFIVIIVSQGAYLYGEISRIIYESNIKTNYTREFAPETLLGDRNFSNNERKIQVYQVVERATLGSSFLGHGFGIGIPVRPVHMEISYLEIFHKQGFLGLLFWGLIFYLLTRSYFSALHKAGPHAHAFYFGSLFIFFQSITNQYFNNPIGMSFIMISIVCLTKINEDDE